VVADLSGKRVSIKIRSVSDGSARGCRLRAEGASASLAEARYFGRRAKAGGPARIK
jgi:hypothetical protein